MTSYVTTPSRQLYQKQMSCQWAPDNLRYLTVVAVLSLEAGAASVLHLVHRLVGGDVARPAPFPANEGAVTRSENRALGAHTDQ